MKLNAKNALGIRQDNKIIVCCVPFILLEPGAEKEKITKLVKSEESKAAKKSEPVK